MRHTAMHSMQSHRSKQPFVASLISKKVADTEYNRYYCLSILDKHHHPDISLDQGMKILNMCSDELKRRLPIDFKGLSVKVISKGGIQEVDFNNETIVKPA